jgi:hypothetical protein
MFASNVGKDYMGLRNLVDNPHGAIILSFGLTDKFDSKKGELYQTNALEATAPTLFAKSATPGAHV